MVWYKVKDKSKVLFWKLCLIFKFQSNFNLGAHIKLPIYKNKNNNIILYVIGFIYAFYTY